MLSEAEPLGAAVGVEVFTGGLDVRGPTGPDVVGAADGATEALGIALLDAVVLLSDVALARVEAALDG